MGVVKIFHVIESPGTFQWNSLWMYRILRRVAIQTNLKLTLVHSIHYCLNLYTAFSMLLLRSFREFHSLTTYYTHSWPLSCPLYQSHAVSAMKHKSQVTFEYDHKKLNCAIKSSSSSNYFVSGQSEVQHVNLKIFSGSRLMTPSWCSCTQVLIDGWLNCYIGNSASEWLGWSRNKHDEYRPSIRTGIRECPLREIKFHISLARAEGGIDVGGSMLKSGAGHSIIPGHF